MERKELLTLMFLEGCSGDESMASHMSDVWKISDEKLIEKLDKHGIKIEKIGTLYFVK